MSATRNDIQRFTEHWQQFLARFGKKDEDTPKILHMLLAQYGGPDRHYHACWHINGALDLVEEARREMPLQILPEDWAAIEHSVIYHDVVYDAKASDNEEQSARLAVKDAHRLGFGASMRAAVETCIMATTHQEPTISRLAQVVCDVDLATLAAPWEQFLTQGRMIRREYAHVPDDQFETGRGSFFLKMLEDRVHIFQTAYFRNRFEAQARENIGRLIAGG